MLNLKDELNIKILSKLYFFKSFIRLKDPTIPSWLPFLNLLPRSRIIIWSISDCFLEIVSPLSFLLQEC